MLYERDFNILTSEEFLRWKKAQTYINSKKELSPKQLNYYHNLMPEAGYHFESLFPNNYLNTSYLLDYRKIESIRCKFIELLREDVSERSILNFISLHQSYFLIGSIMKSNYNFGHHNAYMFKEFGLPPNFIADFLLIGKNSGGYEFIFIELENPFGSIVNVDGTFGITIRKGLKQIEDWDEWIEGNFSHLRLLFQKYLGTQVALPNEFLSLDKTRIHYVIVAGRKSDFQQKTYRLKRKLKIERNILLLHYDNIIEDCEIFRTSPSY